MPTAKRSAPRRKSIHTATDMLHPDPVAATAALYEAPTPQHQHQRHAVSDRHGEATLSFLLQTTVIVLLAVSTGLSVFNTIEISRLRKEPTAMDLAGQKILNMLGTDGTQKDATQMMQSAEDMMGKAADMMEKEAKAVTATTPITAGSETKMTVGVVYPVIQGEVGETAGTTTATASVTKINNGVVTVVGTDIRTGKSQTVTLNEVGACALFLDGGISLEAVGTNDATTMLTLGC
ncbi:hypothetical protein KBD18_02040 [Patescibacteria group bacterium]|nr:hypothetical protein [Patescibacteria group bacterium]